jgi:hypothetical protein
MRRSFVREFLLARGCQSIVVLTLEFVRRLRVKIRLEVTRFPNENRRLVSIIPVQCFNPFWATNLFFRRCHFEL